MGYEKELFTFSRYLHPDGSLIRASRWQFVGAETEYNAEDDTLYVTPFVAGTISFLGLNDTPGGYIAGTANTLVKVNAEQTGLEFLSYTGHANKFLRVNGSEDDLTFQTLSFLTSADTPNSYSGHSGKLVQVNGAGNALIFTEPFNNLLSFNGLMDAPDNYAGAALRNVRVNAAANGLEFATANFTGLVDTPNSYAGHAGKVPTVDAFETGLSFVAPSFTSGTDTPNSYAGQASKIVQVSATEDAIAFSAQKVATTPLFANPQVFTGGDLVVEVGASGALTLQPAASGHTNVPVSTITVIIPAAAGVTSLTCHADYGQDGDPFADFDPAKGYLVFITRFFGLFSVRYAVSGKVIAS